MLSTYSSIAFVMREDVNPFDAAKNPKEAETWEEGDWNSILGCEVGLNITNLPEKKHGETPKILL